jgi:hypothetical protein
VLLLGMRGAQGHGMLLTAPLWRQRMLLTAPLWLQRPRNGSAFGKIRSGSHAPPRAHANPT